MQVSVSATFVAFGCHRKTHTQPIIQSSMHFLVMTWVPRSKIVELLKVKEIIIMKYIKNHNKYY